MLERTTSDNYASRNEISSENSALLTRAMTPKKSCCTRFLEFFMGSKSAPSITTILSEAANVTRGC